MTTLKTSFSRNWNQKLDCNIFSTVRLLNTEKYYIGARHEICYERTIKNEKMYYPLFDANIIYIKSFLLKDITFEITAIDAGLRVDPFIGMIKRMYSHKNINWDTQHLQYILFEKVGPAKNDIVILNQKTTN